MLGYKLHPGGKWRHDYLFADIQEFDSIDFRNTSDPKRMRKVRKQAVQEVRLPDGEINFRLAANYKKAKSCVPLQLFAGAGQPSGRSNVEPLLLGNADADEDAAILDRDAC